MQATLKPLNGKYYGTEVELVFGGESTTITIYLRGDGTPSDRELRSSLGCSRQEFDNNELILEWGGSMVPAQDMWNDYCCDSHYETQASFEAAQELVQGDSTTLSA